MVQCPMCTGLRNVRYYIVLTVEYKTHKSEYIIERTDMTDALVKSVEGEQIFHQTEERVWPITTYPDAELCAASERMIREDTGKFNYARILKQRQILRSVPVSECEWKWKNKCGKFWVYGKENRIEFPNYPQTCCCGCNIL